MAKQGANILITEAELDGLAKTSTMDEWNALCKKVKDARDGEYPGDWYAKVMITGMLGDAEERFKGGGLQIRTLEL